MSLGIQSYVSKDYENIGYRQLFCFRTWLVRFAPLDFQLSYQAWMERGDVDYQVTDRPEEEMTADRFWLWQFLSNPDHSGEFHQPDMVVHAFSAIRERIPEGEDGPNRQMLDRMIVLFSEADLVVFL